MNVEGSTSDTSSNMAVDGHGNLLGWLVFTDESKSTVRLIDRSGRRLEAHKESDGTVWLTTDDGVRLDPRAVQPDDPLVLSLDDEGNPVVVVDGSGRTVRH